MWKENLKFYFILVTTGWLYLALITKSEPVCYSRKVLNGLKSVITLADCDGDSHQICKRFASRKDVTMAELINSPCYKPDGYVSTSERPSQQNRCTAIWCSINDLPNVPNGFFECPNYSHVRVGRFCTLSCAKGFHPASIGKAMCQEGIHSQVGQWSDGNFTCHGCNVWNEWGETEYKVSSTLQNWTESSHLCESESAHLATIENEEENDFLQKMMSYCSSFTYIGLNRIQTGSWEWIDGTVVTYTNWGVGHPGNPDEKCGYMKTSTGTWSDYICGYHRNAVCERRKPLK